MPKILFILLTLFLLSCDSKSNIDNLKQWTYEIDSEYEPTITPLNDTIKPIGLIKFIRTESIKDKQREEIYLEDWFPSIYFEIYDITELEHCKKISKTIKMFSSCEKANVGGDLILVKNYVFVNRGHCLNCVQSENETDYCRPILDKIFSNLNLNGSRDLREINEKIGMKINKASR